MFCVQAVPQVAGHAIAGKVGLHKDHKGHVVLNIKPVTAAQGPIPAVLVPAGPLLGPTFILCSSPGHQLLLQEAVYPAFQ